MKILKINIKNQKEIIEETIRALNQRELVIFPSDTVYGLLVDATDESAVKKLIEFKNRPIGKPISVFLPDLEIAKKYVYIDKNQENTLKKILPGPFTIILQSKRKVSSLIESERKTLGIRIPDFDLVINLVRKFGRPVTATSANISGKPPHYRIDSLLSQLSQKKRDLVDLIVDAGVLPRNKPSTVIDLTQDYFKILRKGDIVFSDEKTYISKSPSQTKKIAKYFFQRLDFDFKKPLVLILKGETGAGKTVFIKGAGEYFGINDIISPTFVIFYEYSIKNKTPKLPVNKFLHFDFYNIKEKEEIDELQINNYLTAGNILAIEWGDKAGILLNLFNKKARVIFIEIEYLSEKERKIVLNF